MFDLCKIIGVEEGEEFKAMIFGYWLIYKVERNQLMYLNDSAGKWVLSEADVNAFANAEIKRQPFVPQIKQSYWSPAISSSGEVIAVWSENNNTRQDLFAIKLNITFRTKEDCEAIGVPLMEQWKKELGW